MVNVRRTNQFTVIQHLKPVNTLHKSYCNLVGDQNIRNNTQHIYCQRNSFFIALLSLYGVICSNTLEIDIYVIAFKSIQKSH